MIEILNYLKIGVGVVLLFGAAIFVHEFGHYWVARRRGMKVEAFAIGMGPKIFGWVRDGIEYSVRWIPAGGFVKLPQMITSSAIEGGADSGDIPPASPFSKILVAVAGPFMNVLFAFAIATVIYFVGLPVPVNPSYIGEVDPGSTEAKLGIHEGDRVVAVNGEPVKSWDEIFKITVLALTNTLPVAIEHDGKTNVFMLRAENTNMVDLKMLNLNPRDTLAIKEVRHGSAAEKAGIMLGDQVVEFAGIPISSASQLTNLVQKFAGTATPIVVKRGNVRVTLHVTPAAGPISVGEGRMGVRFGLDVYELEHPTPWAQVSGVVGQMLATFNAVAHSRSSGVKASDFSGPVGILSLLSVEVNTDYRLALSFLVLLNINLAILNMLPIPVLDGGHIMMAILERIRRRPLEVRVVEYTTTAFAILLISFMIYVTFFDIKRLPLFHSMLTRETRIEQTDKPVQVEPIEKPAPAPANPAK